MKLLFIILAFSFSATAVLPPMSCERQQAIRGATLELLEEKGVLAEEAMSLANEQGVSEVSEELADALSNCLIEPSPMVDLLGEGWLEQEKSCKVALDDFAEQKPPAIMVAHLGILIGIGVSAIGTLTACSDSDRGRTAIY